MWIKKGKISYANEDIYEGDFKNGILDGTGKINYNNGTKYEGEIKNGKPNGSNMQKK